MNKLSMEDWIFSDILFYAEAWKAECSLTLNLASVSRTVIFHAHKHETHHCQTHNQVPDKKLRLKLRKTSLYHIIDLELVFHKKTVRLMPIMHNIYLQPCHSCSMFHIQIQAHLWYITFFNMQMFQHILCKQN
jgi:hypothetical protein